ncbi:MAG TPA: zinc ribbon domain-containing protein [Pyrinomonadaceae bacterium]|nr:zinc ribbon domain-containing protein [Pyrinomonadaceae bacterium]
MYCPSCGTQNADGASFCRGCGANVSLVPQALTGHLPSEPGGRDIPPAPVPFGPRRGKRSGAPSIENAVIPLFMGLAFLFVAFALAYTRLGAGWWFWLFIPAFGIMGRGVAEYLRLKQHENARANVFRAPSTPAAVPPARDTGALPPHQPPAGYKPGSVTEGTTRLLEQDREQ